MVPKTVNARVRSSAQLRGSEAARRTHLKSNPSPWPLYLHPPADAHGLSELDARASATEPGRVFGGDKRLEPEYPSQHFTEQAAQCLGDISHELKAPISRIRVLLERARRSPQDIRSYLARIEDNVLRMEALTKKLLDFSRLELIEESLAKEPCDLAELIGRVVEDARVEAEARGCTIKHSIGSACRALVNHELLHRAVENVVRNSVQYTRRNSPISVVLSCLSSRVAQIVVEDEGPGIPDEELEQVFKPFYRAVHARANETFGAGLGLAISERALKLHGGSITARNRSDSRGLQVTIQIPLLSKSQRSGFPV